MGRSPSRSVARLHRCARRTTARIIGHVLLPTPPRHRAAAAALALAALLIVPSTALGADEFPAGCEGYHTYAEVARRRQGRRRPPTPTSRKRFSIGKSYQGREIWAMKISDNVATDESEPEVLYEGGHHADEHMGVEMALKIMRWLTDGYGTDDRGSRNIVNSREIWIIFLANPDGAEYDIAGGKFHHWRKNRQPTPGTPYIGHGPQPELRLSLGRRRPHEHEPAGHHVPRHEGVLDARGPRRARLPGQPRRRRTAADPGRDLVPRGRAGW